jgi:hypothetical protein
MHESRVVENSVRRETIYLKIIAQSNLCREADVHLWGGGGGGEGGCREVARWRYHTRLYKHVRYVIHH